MARSNRGDTSRDAASRQTLRRPSTATTTARGAASNSSTQGTRGRQTRETSNVADSTSRGRQTEQSTTTGQTGQTTQATTSDRERSIETRDESARTAGRTSESPGGAVPRRSATSPVYGDSNGLGMNPFAAMRRWSEDMDRLFQDFGFGRFGLGLSPFRDLGMLGGRRDSGQNQIGDWSPQVEAFRRGENFVIRADLPGMARDDVKVEVEDNMLTISGERSDENEENREGFYRSERSYGQFYRAIPLPEGVNADQCEATFKDGVLEVSLKAPQQRDKSARQIPIH